MEWELLQHVPADYVREVLTVARRRSFSRREVVFHQDDPADSLHLIVKGRFAVKIHTSRGDPVTIAVRGPGESFGEMALVGEAPSRAATVAALEEGETFAVYKVDFDRVRRDHPGVTDVLVAFLANEVRRQNQLLVEALYLPAEARVLRRLIDLATVYEGREEIPLTQEELAELAGTSRATVNGVLGQEQGRGTLELRRGRIVILDVAQLRRRAR